jgi:TPR repeat protein
MIRGAFVKPLVAVAGAIALSCHSGKAWSADGSVPPSTSQTSSSSADSQLQTVTIQGARSARELKQQVHRFVTSEVFQLQDESLVRWNTPICPAVQGLPAAFNAFLQARIAQIALSARAPVAGKNCAANYHVYATSSPDVLLKKLWAANPQMYDTQHGLGGAESFVRSRRPVRVWYNTKLQCSGAHSASASMEMKGATGAMGMSSAQAPASAVDTTSSSFCSGEDTRLSYSGVNSISSVYIVVDVSRMRDITTIQLADYVAMIGLADVRPGADPGTVPTILRLFQDSRRPPRGLSEWDQALLFSLYNTSQSNVVQTSEMERAVINRITRQPDVGEISSQAAIPLWANELVPQHDAKAGYWFRVEAEQGNPAAEYDQGQVELLGQGVQQDYVKAAQWFRKAAEQGHVDAQYNLGVMCEEGEGVPQDYAQAAEWFRKAAEQGNVNAQSRLGSAYADGQGVPQDYTQAAQWFRRAAAQGDIPAQNYLGAMYADGQGVPQDYAQAVHWYDAAAEEGNTAAQYNLGVMYLLGQGVSRDYANAVQWLRKAAEKGDANAQSSLGLAYAQGRGVPRDYAQAAQWFQKAAEQGNADAQFFLGSMYNRGLGVQRNEVMAYKWWLVAKADSGSNEDAYGRSSYKMRMSASQITTDQMALAHREASEWLAAHQSAR